MPAPFYLDEFRIAIVPSVIAQARRMQLTTVGFTRWVASLDVFGGPDWRPVRGGRWSAVSGAEWLVARGGRWGKVSGTEWRAVRGDWEPPVA